MRLACNDGHVDQVGEALRALKAAMAAVPRAQQRARQLVADARADVDRKRAELAERIVAEYEAGEPGSRVGELAKRSEYSRETIRRILRDAGIEPE